MFHLFTNDYEAYKRLIALPLLPICMDSLKKHSLTKTYQFDHTKNNYLKTKRHSL